MLEIHSIADRFSPFVIVHVQVIHRRASSADCCLPVSLYNLIQRVGTNDYFII